MASSKGTDQASGGKKWNAPEKNPFDIEEGKPRAQAPDQYRWDYIRKALQGDLNAQQAGVPRDSMKQAHEFFISQRRKDLLTGHADRDFLDEFHLWLKGLSRFNRVTSPGGKLLTPWGRRPLTFLPDVQAYLDEFVDQRVRYEQELRKLRLRGVDSLNTAWLYYKYLVRRQLLKRSPDDLRMGIVHFLDDFRTFGNMPTQGVMDRERDPDPVWRQALGATAEAQGIAGPMGLYGKAPTDYTGADGGLQGASNPRAVAQNYSQMMEGRTDALYETSDDMAKRAPIGMGIVQHEEGEPGDLSDPIPYVEDYGDDALFGGDDTTGTTGVKKGGKEEDEDQDDDDDGDDGPQTPVTQARRRYRDLLETGRPGSKMVNDLYSIINTLHDAGEITDTEIERMEEMVTDKVLAHGGFPSPEEESTIHLQAMTSILPRSITEDELTLQRMMSTTEEGLGMALVSGAEPTTELEREQRRRPLVSEDLEESEPSVDMVANVQWRQREYWRKKAEAAAQAQEAARVAAAGDEWMDEETAAIISPSPTSQGADLRRQVTMRTEQLIRKATPGQVTPEPVREAAAELARAESVLNLAKLLGVSDFRSEEERVRSLRKEFDDVRRRLEFTEKEDDTSDAGLQIEGFIQPVVARPSSPPDEGDVSELTTGEAEPSGKPARRNTATMLREVVDDILGETKELGGIEQQIQAQGARAVVAQLRRGVRPKDVDDPKVMIPKINEVIGATEEQQRSLQESTRKRDLTAFERSQMSLYSVQLRILYRWLERFGDE